LIQGGKCKHCKTKISPVYPIFEFLTGALFIVTYLIFGITPELFIGLTFVSTLLIVIICDIRYMIIPDELLIFSGILLFVEKLIFATHLLDLVLDAVIPFVVIFLIKLLGDFLFKKESLGGGDIKLMIIFGIVLGWQQAILSIFLGAIIALPISLLILGIKKTHIIPFGPFLSIAALLVYFFQLNFLEVIDFLQIHM
jgi:leader peptidase (prepilin peptidase)/N-methyltransferase